MIRLHSIRQSSRRALSLLETIITTAILGAGMAGLITLSGQSFGMLSSSNDITAAAQVLQDRIEQIRAASWATITCDSVPDPDEDLDVDDLADTTDDPSSEVLTDPTEFPDDLADTEESEPGLLQLVNDASPSTLPLTGVEEEFVVSKYPEGSTPIRIKRTATGTLTVLSHNADLADDSLVRVTVTVTWAGSKPGTRRSASAQTIIHRGAR